MIGYPTLFIVDGEVGIADPIIDLPDPDATPSPDIFDIYEPAKTDPGPVSGPPASDADPPPAEVEAVVDRLAPSLPSLRSDGMGAVLASGVSAAGGRC